MSKLEKLKARLCSKPKDFTWDELKKLLEALGYFEVGAGKTGGSRRRFVNPVTKSIITLHKPHPGSILKDYQLKDIIEKLDIC